MINGKRIIAALNQLNANKDERKEWLAIRKKIGADIDPDNAVVDWTDAQVLDPYCICPSFPTDLYQVGREYFARALNGEIWVSFDDLPRRTVSALWPRMQAGEFDEPPDWAGRKPELVKLAEENGLSPHKLFWQPTIGPLAAIPLAGRVALRNTTQTHGPLIVKDADLGSFILAISINDEAVYLAGWIDVHAAKQFPTFGSAVHFIDQTQLCWMDDLQKYVEIGLKK